MTRWEDFHILPGVAEGIALLNRAGFSVIVVTNQRCIAKGHYDRGRTPAEHARANDRGQLARAGAED